MLSSASPDSFPAIWTFQGKPGLIREQHTAPLLHGPLRVLSSELKLGESALWLDLVPWLVVLIEDFVLRVVDL